jgi:uncharacterized membrane protein YhaH (DUF805 family)
LAKARAIVIKGSRWRGAAFAAALATLAALTAGALGASPATAALAGLWLALAAAAAVAGAWLATAPARIAGRVRRWTWVEIYDFRPVLLGLASRRVGFSLAARPRPALGRLTEAAFGVEAALAPGWEVDAATLARLLNAARERWLERAAGVADARPPLRAGFVGARTGPLAYWLAIAALMGLTALLAKAGWPLAALALAPWSARTYAGRLNDCGWSGWWQLTLWAVLAISAAASLGAQPLPHALDLAFAAWTIFTVGLGLAPGDGQPNRFGPRPGEPSPLALAEAFR